MTDLQRLRVSRTKHGAHKIYRLIEHFPLEEVLDNTWDRFEGIRIDRAQSRKNLSAVSDDQLPAIWGVAKNRSVDTLKRLVFLAIVFSHHDMIEAFRRGRAGHGRGRIELGVVLSGKAFTNTKNDLEELGLATDQNSKVVAYDLRGIIDDPDLSDLAAQLFQIKLTEAEWDGAGPLVDECVRLGFHEALSISEVEFREWLAGASGLVPEDDELPEATDPDEEVSANFIFVAGHKLRKTGTAARRASVTLSARLRHNAIQNQLVQILSAQLGAENVGTELRSGSSGTSIDLVIRDAGAFDFYEIKTSSSVKKCLRQAISQLLEYAYWPNETRAERLVVVAEATVTADARAYLKHLREKLGIPIHYRSIDLREGTLSDLY